jgi:pyruvate,water dikinase
LVRDPVTGKNVKKLLTPDEEKLQVLTDRQILELARYGKKIHEHYGKPQDIEWAIEKDRIYIVQSRAVTTFKPQTKQETSKEMQQNGEILLHGETASAGSASGPVRIILSARELNKVQQGDILVTKMTNPDMVPAMQRAAAIITDEGGMTSHAAIVSREIGIPCIVGTERATKLLKNDQVVTVDATNGNIYGGKRAVQSVQQVQIQAQQTHTEEPVTATQIKVVMDFPKYAQQVAEQTQADGVGLLRLEFIIAGGAKHPAQYIRENKDAEYTALLVEEIKKVAQAFKDKPVWARCSDIRTDEYRNLTGGKGEPHESDPMIGWHGIRRLLDEPRMLKAEFQAIKQLHQQGFKNVGIMIPFVIRADEVKQAKQILREVGLEPGKDVEFGVMIETPASCWEIEDICKEGINFVSFGTNDLTQLTLGIDRNNQRIQKLYDEMHPAVLGEIAMVIKVCKKYGVTTSICGQAGSRPEMAEFLIRHGIDSISPNPDAVHKIKHIVAQAEKKILMEKVR